MRSALLLFLAVFAAAPTAPLAATVVPGTPSAETDIASALGRWDRARAQSDRQVLAEIMAEDFTATRADGGRLTRKDILAGRAPEAGARLIYREDIAIQVRGRTATAMTKVIRIGTAAGPEQGEVTRESITLRLEGASWRLVSSRSAYVARA